MAVLANQTLVGSIGRVYDLRTVGRDNQEVIDFTVAVTPRKKVDGEWTDGETYWITVTAWGKLAKNVSESFNSGDRVFVYGRTDMKNGYTNKEGVEVPARPIVIAEFTGLELSFHPAHSDRPARGDRERSENRSSNNSRSNSSSNSAPSVKKPAPKSDDDLDFGDDDDEGFSPF